MLIYKILHPFQCLFRTINSKLIKVNTKLFFFFLLSFTFFSLSSQTQISGKVLDKSNGEALIGVSIIIENSTDGVVTDIDGNYNISLKPGRYTLIFSYVGYEDIKETVETSVNQISYLDVAMGEAKNVLSEVVVTAKLERSGLVAMMLERKKAAAVSDGISADQIRKTPDRTTSDLLKRVTGASIQEGKFAIIRGMNDRYNAGYLDGALLPSTEADRKAFSFDVLPANLIDNVVILKAGTPDLIGDFGGGVIKINAKAVPEQFSQSITIGAQTHSLTTFSNFVQSKLYAGEQFNILGKERAMPELEEGAMKISSTFPTTSDKTRLSANTLKFNNDWSTKNINASPNARFAYSLGFPIKLSGVSKLGVVFAVNYANTRKQSLGLVNTYDDSGVVAAFDDNLYSQNINTGGIFNVSFNSTSTQINFRNLLNYNLDNNTTQRNGMGNVTDDLKVQNHSNLVSFNRLYNNIVSVKQIVGNKFLTVNASVNYSNILRKVPDYRIVNYTQPSGSNGFNLALGDFFNSSSGRFTSSLNENLVGVNLDLAKEFKTENISTEIKVGFFNQNRNRLFTSNTYVYGGNVGETTLNPMIDLGQNNIGASKLYLVDKTSTDLAYYSGTSKINAYYVSLDQRFFEKLRAVYGVRYESANINVDNQKLNTPVANLKKASILPSINLSYALTDRINIRADYFASVNRPEFRELAPFAFYVFDKNSEIKGNNNLQIATLNNYDVRFELFPSGNQLISIGGFYKTIQNPVEFSIDLSQPFTTFTYQNEKSAKIYGLEIEAKKSLDFISTASIFSDLSFFTNLSLIKSKLDFDASSQAKQDRPLQGQSPYIVNFGLQYESKENGWFASLIGNRVGRRIAYVGVDAKYAPYRLDIYEAPRSVLDFQVGKNIKNINVKLTFGDILHNDLTFYQDNNGNGNFDKAAKGQTGDSQMFLYKNGFTAALSFNYTFKSL
jgi:outer membrane receptor protein involved in Fe transport